MTALTNAEALARIFGRDGLRVLFQPIAQLGRRPTLFAAEALVRGPAGSPWEAAEALFSWARVQKDPTAFHRATAEAVLAASAQLPETVDVAVNLPAQTLVVSPTFVASFLEAARRRAVRTTRIVAELHGAAQVSDDAALLAGVAELRAQGVRIAVDGELEAAHVRSFHALAPDLVKLDWRLVRDSAKTGRRAQIAELHRLARSLGARTVAEGVETLEDETFLREQGIDLLQGHLLAAAMPMAKLLEHPLLLARVGMRPTA